MSADTPTATAKKTHAEITKQGSALRRYQDVVVGRRSLRATLYYEWCLWLAGIPGALGLMLRGRFWPRLFGACGRGVVFGAGVILRHPHRIHIGDRVVVSDGCILDARNEETDQAVVLGDDIILSNGAIIQCKAGTVRIGARAGIGLHSIIQSTNGCPVSIGDDVVIAPHCYVVGGSNYRLDRLDIPIWRQGIVQDAGVVLDDNTWLGAHVTVLSGATLRRGAVAAAGAVVGGEIPENAICGGVPAKVIKRRSEGGP